MLILAAALLTWLTAPAVGHTFAAELGSAGAPHQEVRSGAVDEAVRGGEKKDPAGYTYYILGNGNSFRKPERAVEYYKTAIKKGYDTVHLRLELGKLLNLLGRHAHASEHYRAAVRMDKENVPARLGLAYSLLKRGGYQEALEEFEILKRAAPGDYGLGIFSLYIGECLDAAGRHKEALKEYEAALRCNCYDEADEGRIRKRVEVLKENLPRQDVGGATRRS